MNKKGVIFFTADTMIAALVLAMTIIILLSFYINQPISSDVLFLLNEYEDYVLYTDMKNIDSIIYTPPPEESEIGGLKVHEKILLLHRNNSVESEQFVSDLSDMLISDVYGISYSLDDEVVFKRGIHDEVVINLSKNILTYFVYEDEIYGPNITKVSIWY